MASFSVSQWLEQIDPSMKEYAKKLQDFGFGTLKTLRNIDADDINSYIPEMKPGHKKALLGEARKLVTPVKGINPSKDQASISQNQRCLEFTITNSCKSISNPTPTSKRSGPDSDSDILADVMETSTANAKRARKETFGFEAGDDVRMPKTLEDKEERLVMELSKLEAEIDSKEEEINCYLIPVDTLPEIGKMASVCSVCHRKGHRAEGNKSKKNCLLDKCESYFICGQKSKHPEYGRVLSQKKKYITNLKESAANVKQQLEMLKQFHEKTSETNFMLDIKRRLRITDPKKYRNVALLLKDTRTLKIAYKGKIPPVGQNDSEEFPRLITKLRHKIKSEKGDFNLSDSEDTIDLNNQSVTCMNRESFIPNASQVEIADTSYAGENIDIQSPPSGLPSTWQGSFMGRTMPIPFPSFPQQQYQWFPFPVGYPAQMNSSTMSAESAVRGFGMQPNQIITSGIVPNNSTNIPTDSSELPELPLSDLENFLDLQILDYQ